MTVSQRANGAPETMGENCSGRSQEPAGEEERVTTRNDVERLGQYIRDSDPDMTEVEAATSFLHEAHSNINDMQDNLANAALSLRDAGWPDEGETWDGAVTLNHQILRRTAELVGAATTLQRAVEELEDLLRKGREQPA